VDARTPILSLLMLALASTAWAQGGAGQRPRRHFVTFSVDSLYTHPLHFAEYPLADLAGADVAAAQREAYGYHTRDGAVLIHVHEFSRRQRGAGLTVYPFGMNSGPALLIRGSVEQLPRIRVDLEGQAPVQQYALTDGRAFDAAAGVTVADRAAGWGLGSHGFIAAGVGRITSGLGDGRRVFAEGGGGLGVGPFGVEIAVKFAWNTLDSPVTHHFLTVPVTVRGTLTF
jgi:hypothetical protein